MRAAFTSKSHLTPGLAADDGAVARAVIAADAAAADVLAELGDVVRLPEAVLDDDLVPGAVHDDGPGELLGRHDVAGAGPGVADVDPGIALLQMPGE